MAADQTSEPDIHPGHNDGDPVVLDFTTPDKTGARPWQQVTLDGETLWVREPKNSFWLNAANTLDGSSNGADEIRIVNQSLDIVFDDESREHVRARLDDPEDDFDVEEFGEILNKLQAMWGKGHGGSASASRRPSQRRTTRSTARRR